jgi:DNA (cytosine-5)-methyltransferase 1
MAGYKPIGFVENDNYATKTYVENIHKNENVGDHQIDITNFESKREFICQFATKNVDVILGGFPCKGFSLSGSRVLTDHRNSLYRDMLEIVKEISPKYVVMENVTGILSMYSGLVIDKIISDYNHIGYKISYAILNSANYYVPQNRRRVIMIANKINQPNYFPLPLIKEEENFITTGQCLIKYLELDEDPSINHIFSTHSEEMKNRLSSVPEGGTLFPNYNDSWKKSPWDKPSCTVKENHGATNIHPKLPRVITAREMAALQSFPDDFIFYGSKSSQLRQIGNAVPPLLSKAVALAIEKGLISNIMNK